MSFWFGNNQEFQYQVSMVKYPMFLMTEDFCPSRRNIEFMPSEDVSILPLINDLNFIQNKKVGDIPFALVSLRSSNKILI